MSFLSLSQTFTPWTPLKRFIFFLKETYSEILDGFLKKLPSNQGAKYRPDSVQHLCDPSSGPLAWLDGSPFTYSNWLSSPPPGAACAHIRRGSDFQWVATSDCNKTLPFICQFGTPPADPRVGKIAQWVLALWFTILHHFCYFTERGRSIICASHDAALQCDSGRVLIIDRGFYGRRNVHYCRPGQLKVTTATQLRCSWVDVAESLKGMALLNNCVRVI